MQNAGIYLSIVQCFFLPFFAFFVFSKHKSFLVVALHCFSLSAITARWIVFSSESIFSCLSETVEREREVERKEVTSKKCYQLENLLFVPTKNTSGCCWCVRRFLLCTQMRQRDAGERDEERILLERQYQLVSQSLIQFFKTHVGVMFFWFHLKGVSYL